MSASSCASKPRASALVLDDQQQLALPVGGGDVQVRAAHRAAASIGAHRLGVHVWMYHAEPRGPPRLVVSGEQEHLASGLDDRIHARVHELGRERTRGGPRTTEGLTAVGGAHVPDQGADADPAAERAQERVLELEDEREAVDHVDVRSRRVDQLAIRLERACVAEARGARPPAPGELSTAGGTSIENAPPPAAVHASRNERSSAATAGPSIRAPASSHGTSRHSDAGVIVTSVERGVVLVREVAPAEERELSVRDHELAMIALLEVRRAKAAR